MMFLIFYGHKSLKSNYLWYFVMMFNLDKTDTDILRLLQQDAGNTIKEIADRVRKSVPTVHERIRRLKSEGYIRKTVALVDRKKVGKNLIAICLVTMNDHAYETLNGFERGVCQFTEVMECLQMAGTLDFILRIAVKDMDDYQEFYRNKLAKLPNITTVQSLFVMSEAKSDTAYPL